MSSIEIRVRPVTRYQITIHETTGPDASGRGRASTIQFGEFDSLDVANRIGRMQADVEREAYAEEPSTNVSFHGVDQRPGVDMRCKVALSDRRPNVRLQWGGEAQGRKETRDGPNGDYTWVDPADPMNYVIDGETVTYHAVWGGQAEDGKNACRENRIFSDATPSFSLSCVIRGPDALAALGEPGAEYYVDFTPAPKTIAPS